MSQHEIQSFDHDEDLAVEVATDLQREHRLQQINSSLIDAIMRSEEGDTNIILGRE